VNAGIAEIVGLFLVIVGCGTIVAAASLVSTALAVLAAGLFLVLGGALAVYAAAVLERQAKATPPRVGERT
jgi:membrane protein implicated in regulation of membrane protease activity